MRRLIAAAVLVSLLVVSCKTEEGRETKVTFWLSATPDVPGSGVLLAKVKELAGDKATLPLIHMTFPKQPLPERVILSTAGRMPRERGASTISLCAPA